MCINSNLKRLTKFISISSRSSKPKVRIYPIEYILHDQEGNANQQEDNQKLCNEKEHSSLSSKKS